MICLDSDALCSQTQDKDPLEAMFQRDLILMLSIIEKLYRGKIHVDQVGGFFHVTNLDVYREDSHQKFLKELVGDYRFNRRWDDQLAVTVIPAMKIQQELGG